ncbi:hypothetical protein GW17_00005825 [Ensete ventricosum]|nr:hypothetical protein GW17_00005825 [Ensete ventricosum]
MPNKPAPTANGATLKCNPCLSENKTSIRGLVAQLLAMVNPEKPLISLGVGDASSFPCFRNGKDFSDSLLAAVSSSMFDCYPPSYGFPFARRFAYAVHRPSLTRGERLRLEPSLLLHCSYHQSSDDGARSWILASVPKLFAIFCHLSYATATIVYTFHVTESTVWSKRFGEDDVPSTNTIRSHRSEAVIAPRRTPSRGVHHATYIPGTY